MASRLKGVGIDCEAVFRERISSHIAISEALLADLGECLEVANALIEAYRRQAGLVIFGNGGSASDAQHIAAEFVGLFYRRRPSLRAVALTTNLSTLTSIANDLGYGGIFARQIEALARPGDVVIGMTTSGNSENVIEGLRAARKLGYATVAMTGQTGGRARAEVDHWIGVPSTDVARIQEGHMLIGHIWSELVEQALFPDAPAAHNGLY